MTGSQRKEGSTGTINSEPEFVVIGVGNEFRGDDGVGPFIAHKLKFRSLPRTSIRFQRNGCLSLMEAWRDARTVFLLDAVKSGASPGKIHRFNAHKDVIPAQFFNPSTHQFGIAEVIELARTLHRLPPCFIVYGVEGRRFGEGTGLSPEAEKAAMDVIVMVVDEIYDIAGNSVNRRSFLQSTNR